VNTVVCLKQVPDTETLIKVAGTTIAAEGIKWVISSFDEYAVEEAIQFVKDNPTAKFDEMIEVAFVPLRGKHGWDASHR